MENQNDSNEATDVENRAPSRVGLTALLGGDSYSISDDDFAALKRLARVIGHRNSLDSMDVFQEGCLALWKTHLMRAAIGAMQEYARRERAERYARRELMTCWKFFRMTSRSFDGLLDVLQTLESRDRRIIDSWLDGNSLSQIALCEQVARTTVKRSIVKTVVAIAAWCGKENVNMEAIFPETTRLLPKGIRCRDGRFVAYAGRSGRVYLGTYDSLEQAVEARRRWSSDFVTSPLDML